MCNLNPNRFAGPTTPVKLWIYANEYAHQTVEPDEVKADCVAVRRGHCEDWLTESGGVREFMDRCTEIRVIFTGRSNNPQHIHRFTTIGLRRCDPMRWTQVKNPMV